MRCALRAAALAAALASCGVVAATATAAGPPLNYDLDILSQFDANNSYETVRHLAVDIGPRRSGLPEEDEAAEYLASRLAAYGFEPIPGQSSMVFQYPLAGTRPAAKVTSPDTELFNGPNWQMAFAPNSKITTNDSSVTAPVLWVTAATEQADYPAALAGKIALMQTSTTAATRNTQIDAAIKAGAVGVIAFGTGQSPLNVGTLPTAQPDAPVLGGGDMHADELKKALCPGVDPDATPAPTPCADQRTVTLKLVTNNWGNLTRAVVVGRRKAVSDPEGNTAPIVMVGAHIDSVLGAPGAHDDATGNGVAMEIARVVSKLPLDKEIWIGGFGGEEDGLTGSRAWVNQFLAGEANTALRSRFIGEWQMDMVGTPYPPARLWALTPNGMSNFVVDEAYKSVERMPESILEPLRQPGIDFDGLQNCRLGQSDHQAFYDIGIPSALFIWLDYRKPASGICGPTGGTYVTEPEYHTPRDGMNNVSVGRMQAMLNLIGSSYAHNAMNRVDLVVKDGGNQPVAGAEVTGDCGDGVREFGTTDEFGYLEVRTPHVTCSFTAVKGDVAGSVSGFAVHGDKALTIAATNATAGGSVPATLALSLGAAASFGPFTPGVARTYEASTTANVISTAGDALLSVSDPGAEHTGKLVNGAFALASPLSVTAGSAAGTAAPGGAVGGSSAPTALVTYSHPVSNDAVTIAFKQDIGANEPLRTGTYSKTLTFTLSTTTP